MGSEFSGAQGGAKIPVTVDYYAVLSRAVEASKADPSLLRSAIYSMARASLDREATAHRVPMTGLEYKTHKAALERAIQKIEAEFQRPSLLFLSPRVDFAIQIVLGIFLVIAVLAVAIGYIEVHAVKNLAQ